MKKKRIGEIILIGMAGVAFFATVSKGASLGQRVQVQDVKKEKSRNIELTGVLDTALQGKRNLSVEIFSDLGLTGLLFSKEFSDVEFTDGFYSLPINLEEAGLEVGGRYGLRITVLGEETVTTQAAAVEIVPSLTIQARENKEDGPTILGQYTINGTFPAPGYVVKVTNLANGTGIQTQSNGGTALLAESRGAGIAVQATHADGGVALKAQGNTEIAGDLTVSGQTSLTNVDLPANSVGSTEIIDDTIVNADIAANANIAAAKINRTNLNADQLDGKDSSEFLAVNPNGDLAVRGNLTVQGTGNSSVTGNLGIGTTTPAAKLDVAHGNIGITTSPEPNIIGSMLRGVPYYGDPANIPAAIEFRRDNNGYSGEEGKIIFRATDIPRTLAPERMVITGAGNVGIGTTNPQYPLDIQTPNGYAGIVADLRGEDGLGLQFWKNDTLDTLGLGASGRHGFLVSQGESFAFKEGSDHILLVIAADGKVGLGTEGPRSLLEIEAADATAYNASSIDAQSGQGSTLRVHNRNNTLADTFSQIVFSAHDTSTGFARIGGELQTTNQMDLFFVTQNQNDFSEKMRITAEGKVGIGTNVPLQKLHVAGGIHHEGCLSDNDAHQFCPDGLGGQFFSNGYGFGAWHFMDVHDPLNKVDRMSISVATGDLTVGGDIKIHPDKGVLLYETEGDASQGLAIKGNPSNNTFLFETFSGTSEGRDIIFKQKNIGDVLTITKQGRVGIGTVNPSHKLHVVGDILTESGDGTSGGAIYLGNSGHGLRRFGNDVDVYTQGGDGNVKFFSGMPPDERVRITPAGDVGIGLTVPTAKLDVNGYVKGRTGLCIGDDCRTVWPSEGGGGGIGGIGTTNYLSKFTGSSTIGDSLIFDNGINVGIGTTNPAQKLDVAGKIKGTELCISSDCRSSWPVSGVGGSGTTNYVPKFTSGTNIGNSTIFDNGNVGIGTTSPSAKLHVVGNGKINGTLTTKEVIVTQSGWADYVFDKDYTLLNIEDLEKKIKELGHLPGIPSAEEVKENGVSLGELQTALLQKIEELTLYIIEQNKRIQLLEERNRQK